MRLDNIFASKTLRDFTIGLSACLVLATAGCGYTLAGKWKYTEIRRVKSPDSQIEAVLVEGDAGATTSAYSKIYLVPTGAKLEVDERADADVFAADHLKGFNIVWKEGRLLEIQYEEARILGFRNFWYGRSVHDANYVVELQLRPATTNRALPLKDRM